MFTLASHSDYRGRGIATELVNQALKVDQALCLVDLDISVEYDYSRLPKLPAATVP